MDKETRLGIEEEIESALDELSYDLPYDIDSYNETDFSGTSYAIFDIDFDFDEIDESTPDDWMDEVEGIIENIAFDWDGRCYWSGSTLILSIENDDDDEEDDDEEEDDDVDD